MENLRCSNFYSRNAEKIITAYSWMEKRKINADLIIILVLFTNNIVYTIISLAIIIISQMLLLL